MNVSDEEKPPIPDPTRLTTEQLDKGLLSLRELLESEIRNVKEQTAAMNARIEKCQDNVDAKINSIKELYKEKFESVEKQFIERDTRTGEIAALNQKAIDAALQAAEKAVGKQQESNSAAMAKSESAIAKQIDLQGELQRSGAKAADDKINDIKERLTGMESRTAGITVGKEDVEVSRGRFEKRSSDNLGLIIGAIGVLIAIIVWFSANKQPILQPTLPMQITPQQSQQQ